MIVTKEEEAGAAHDFVSEAPPTYLESTAQSSASSFGFPPPPSSHGPPSSDSADSNRIPQLPPRINHLNLHSKNGSVRGKYLVDTSMRIPLALLNPLPPGETTRPNLVLSSTNGSVNGEVWLQGSERAILRGESTNGGVTIQIMARSLKQTVSVTAQSKNGPVAIQLPRDFCGLIRWKTKHGSVRFSQAIQTQLTRFGQRNGVEHGFLGHFEGFGDGEWDGDEAKATSRNGSVHFSYVGEPRLPGVFENMFKNFFG